MTEASARKSQDKKHRDTIPLTPQARQVHQRILAGFVETGRALRHRDLAHFALGHGIELGPVFTELGDLDMVVFDDRGEIRAAYPFSPSPTPIQVSWAGGPVVYAMCAIDALGMSAMLGRQVMITAAEPGTGHAVTVEVDRDRAQWSPGGAVVFVGSADSASCISADRSCGYINFFTSVRAAHSWADQHPDITGRTLAQARALRRGIAEFGTLMRPAEGG
jgi:hypothetical protein